MKNKEIFINNLSKISKGMKNKEIAAIIDRGEGTVSKYMNPEMDNFPTVEDLIKLSEHFNVSIDWLVGNSASVQQTGLSPRKVCEMLLSIFNSGWMSFYPISVSEDCWDMIDADQYNPPDVRYEKKTNKYNAIYFSEQWQPKTEEDCMLVGDVGNLGYGYDINNFLNRLTRIANMKKDGSLDQEMYDILLEKYLSDVPDK